MMMANLVAAITFHKKNKTYTARIGSTKDNLKKDTKYH